MIGTFVGWQASLLIFFLAPAAGIVIGVCQWIAHRDQEIPYGPFLCLAASFIVVQWVGCWEWCRHAFETGWLVPAALAVCMTLLAIALGIWRLIRERVLGWD
jgi:leader peptidase (prepilin peptidase) / N-methyltransferase